MYSIVAIFYILLYNEVHEYIFMYSGITVTY